MSDNPLERLDSQVLGSDNPNSTVRIRKRDKLREFMRFPKSKSKDVTSMTSNQLTRPSSIVPLPVIQDAKLQPSIQPLQSNKALVVMDFFPDNLLKPVVKTELPRLHERIESTEQLVYCASLLRQNLLSPSAVPGDDEASDAALFLQESTLNKAEINWLKEMEKDLMERGHLCWLLTRMVEVLVADTSKDSVKIAEIVALGPVLQKEPYRHLFSSLIKDFDDAGILDVNILQGLVGLVQSASSDYLVSDDLVRILTTLRTRLQGTHQQSPEYAYHLTLAVSKVLD
ncbi:hypothetical protein BGZ95_002389, partial [Linnemannia exigua]